MWIFSTGGHKKLGLFLGGSKQENQRSSLVEGVKLGGQNFAKYRPIYSNSAIFPRYSAKIQTDEASLEFHETCEFSPCSSAHDVQKSEQVYRIVCSISLYAFTD